MVDLPELAGKVATRFMERWPYFRECVFDRVLKTCFECTEPGDTKMRHRLLQWCLWNSEDMERQPEVVAILEEYEPTLWRLGSGKYQECIKLKEELKTSNKDLASAREESNQRKRRIDELESELEQAKNKIRKYWG